MKKIIYSLVIMIAAGCLFTSCVETKVDEGRQELLKAKAEYLNALSTLRAADAELVKAEAAVEQAKAAVLNAKADYQKALTEAERIANEALQAKTDVAKAKAEAKIAEIKAEAAIAAAENEAALAVAMNNLATTLRNIEAASYGLNDAEVKAIQKAVAAYQEAGEWYEEVAIEYYKAEAALWDFEYDQAAGYESINPYGATPLKNWKDSIALREAKIAFGEKALEYLDTTAQKWAKMEVIVRAFKDSINALKVDSTKAWADFEMVKAVELPTAAAVFNKKVKDFYTDSVAIYKSSYQFGKKGKATVYTFDFPNQRYNLLRDVEVYAGALTKYGLSVKPAPTPATKSTISIKADPKEEEVDTILNGSPLKFNGLKGIVSALERDMVITERDSIKGKSVEKLEKESNHRDSIYDLLRARVEKGFDSTFPGYAVAEAKYKKAVDDSAKTYEAYKAAMKVVVKDSATAVAAIKVAAKAYKAAFNNFIKAYNNIAGTKFASKTAADSAAFIAAAKALGKAKAAYFGSQDTLKLWEVKSDKYYLTRAIPFSEFTAEGFVQTVSQDGTKATALYGGEKGYGAFAFDPTSTKKDNAWYKVDKTQATAVTYKYTPHYTDDDAFVKVANLAFGATTNAEGGLSSYTYDFTAKIADTQYQDVCQLMSDFDGKFNPYDSASPIAFYTSYTDTIKWHKECVAKLKGVPAEFKTIYDSLENHKKVMDKALDTAIKYKPLAKALAAKKAVKVKFTKVVAAFFGDSINPVTKDTVAYFRAFKNGFKLDYSRATFEEPYKCVWFTQAGKIYKDSTLSIIIDQLKKNVNHRSIFYGKTFKDGKFVDTVAFESYYTKTLKANQLFDMAKNWTSVKEQLAEFKAAVEDIEAKQIAAKADVKGDKVAYKAAIKRLTGKEDGKVVDDISGDHATGWVSLETGKWNLGGLQKQWAEELAPNFPAAYAKAYWTGVVCSAKIKYLTGIVNKFEEVLVKVHNAETGHDHTSVADIHDDILALAKHINAKIAELEEEIVIFQKAVAMEEAGLDPQTIEHEKLQAQVIVKKAIMEEAAKYFAAAKATYEAVMAKYLNVTE